MGKGGILRAREIRLSIGGGKVRKHAFHAHMRAILPARKQRVQLAIAARSQAGHAGIHLQVGKRGKVFRTRRAFQALQGVHGKHGRGNTGAHRFALIARAQAAQHEDGARYARLAQRQRFFKDGNGKHIRARAFQAAGDVRGAVAIGVGLDHGDELYVRRERGADFPVIPFDGAKGNRQAGASHKASTSSCESTRTPAFLNTSKARSGSERRRMIRA